MIEKNHKIPKEIYNHINKSSIKFLVKCEKEQPVRNLISLIRGGLFWIFITGSIFSAFIYELFQGKPTSLFIWGEPVTVYPDDLSPLWGFFSFAALFMLPGFILILLGVFGFYRKGGYFIGSDDKIIKYNSWKELSIYKWLDFTGEIDAFEESGKGNFIFELKEKNKIKRNNKTIEKNKKLTIAGVNYFNEINMFCRNKITNANNV